MRLGFLPAALVLSLGIAASPLSAQVPNFVPHQGRVAVNGQNFNGQGHFKFALVNGDGTITYWSNDGSSASGAEPTAGVTLPVTKGLYSLMLGDTALANMTAVPSSVYANADLRLRVWFNDGTQGFQKLSPDQRLAPNGYLPDGSITAGKLAPGANSPAIAVSGSTQDLAPNQRYVATGSTTTTFNLPLAAKPGDQIRIDSAGSGGMTINDSGDSVWKQASFGGGNITILDIFCPGDGSTLWGLAVSSGTNYPSVFRGTLSGLWPVGPSGKGAISFASSQNSTKVLVGTFTKALYRSVNSGSTWEQVGPTAQIDWRHLAVSADGSRMYAAADSGQLHISTDSGATWVAVGSARGWQRICCSADGMKVFAGLPGSPSSSITLSNDGGMTWTTIPATFGGINNVKCSDDGSTVALSTFGMVAVSRDGGQTWNETPMGAAKMAMSGDGSTIAVCNSGSALRISRDGGQTWASRENSRSWSGIACSKNGRTIAAVINGLPWFYYSSGTAFSSSTSGSMDLVYGDSGWRVSRGIDGWTQNGNHISLVGGNLGIGTTTPAYPLSFGDNLGTKIVLHDAPDSNADYGIGTDTNQMLFHVGEPGGRFSFLDGPSGNEVMKIGTGTTSGVTIKTAGDFSNPQLLLNQTAANDWSRLRMKSNGPEWDIALSSGATPVLNVFNGSANVLSLEHEGNALLTKNLNFSTGSGTRQMLNLWNNEHAIGVQSWTTYFRTIGNNSGAFAWYRGGVHHDGQYNAGGGEELMRLNSGGLTVRGTFVSSSDRNMKENIREVDAREVLEKVVSMPVSRWNYLDDPGSEHIGPMAQDFHAAFSAGADDKHIATVDADGVALAAIKGLNEKIGEKDKEIESLRERNEAMEARLEALEKAMLKLGEVAR